MSKQDFVINGGQVLKGEISVYGSKNAALPLIAATLLTKERMVLENIPAILDVERMGKIIESLGAQVVQENDVVEIVAGEIDQKRIVDDEIGQLRGSVLLLGALLGRDRKVSLPMPGGDIIGARPIETHLDAFRQLGAKIKESNGIIKIDGSNMKSGDIVLREFSVTATENALLVAASLPGTTTISIAAAEPHVKALAEMLDQMGAEITGAGTHNIIVEGSERLRGVDFKNIPDMLEAGFFILMAAATGSELKVAPVPVEDLQLFFKKMDDIGVKYDIDQNKQVVTVKKSELKSFSMQSLPFPGIPTDLQAPFSVIATQAEGSSLIHDPMYEGRLKHIVELQKMGARAVMCDPHRVIVSGPTKLHGSEIPSLDIRSGATLILAGLVAEGETIIKGADIVDRGYANLTERLQAVGAKISRRES